MHLGKRSDAACNPQRRGRFAIPKSRATFANQQGFAGRWPSPGRLTGGHYDESFVDRFTEFAIPKTRFVFDGPFDGPRRCLGGAGADDFRGD